MGLNGTLIDNIILVSCTWLLILNELSNLALNDHLIQTGLTQNYYI